MAVLGEKVQRLLAAARLNDGETVSAERCAHDAKVQRLIVNQEDGMSRNGHAFERCSFAASPRGDQPR